MTIDCVRGDAYMGGLIFPGPRTALAALSREAARLPRIDLEVSAAQPEPGRSTAMSMKHGLVFGFVCMVEGLTARLRQQMPPPAAVLGRPLPGSVLFLTGGCPCSCWRACAFCIMR